MAASPRPTPHPQPSSANPPVQTSATTTTVHTHPRPLDEIAFDMWVTGSLLRILVLAIVFGLLVSGVGIGLDALLVREHDSPRIIIEASDGFTGVIAGLLFLRILMAARTRRQRVLERLNAISELNDQIRNSLQIISLTAHALPEQRALDLIDNTVNRIESTLRDVTPKI